MWLQEGLLCLREMLQGINPTVGPVSASVTHEITPEWAGLPLVPSSLQRFIRLIITFCKSDFIFFLLLPVKKSNLLH